MTPKEKKRLKYYTNRFKDQESEVNKLTVAQQKKLISVYKEAAKELESDLAVFLEKYSRANKLESADLKRMLNTQELANFKYTIKGYVDEIERLGKDTLEGKALKKELDILAGRTRVSRMQELKTQIETEINKATLTASSTIKNHLSDVVDYSYTDTMEILKNNTLARLDNKIIQRIVAQKWSGKNYSSRIWDNRRALVDKVMKVVVSGIAQGHDYIKMTEKLQEKMKSGYFETRRLIHTETTFALERAKEHAFKELGVKKYKFIAVMDKDTSPICQKLNGQEFDMKDRQQGLNCPPMHPFCRSVTVAIVDLKKYSKQEPKKSGIIENKIFRHEKLKTVMELKDYDEYMELINTGNAGIKKLYSKHSDNINSIKLSKSGGSYSPFFNNIDFSYANYAGVSKYRTLAHEFGHYFDKTEYFVDLNYSEIDTLNNKLGFIKSKLFTERPSSSDEFLGALDKDMKHLKSVFSANRERILQTDASAGVQDAIDGMFGYFDTGKVKWGHGNRYYDRLYSGKIKAFKIEKQLKEVYNELGKDASSQIKVKKLCRRYETASEAWANINSAIVCGGEELKYVQEFLPNMYTTFLDISKKIK